VSDGLLEIKLLKVGLSKKVPLAKAATVLIRTGRLQEATELLTRAKYFGEIVVMDDQGRVLIPAVLHENWANEG